MNSRTMAVSATARQDFLKGGVDMLPLCLAVLPWGILAGSMAVNTGLSLAQSIGMSAIIFAGAAQLVTLGMLAAGASMLTIVVSVFFITAQHLLYGLTLRPQIAPMKPLRRFGLGFLLTDELFALSTGDKKSSFAYLFGAGLTFYLAWVLFSLAGIALASAVPDLDAYHLDFSIVATFITIVVPMLRNFASLVGVVVSLVLSIVLTHLQIEGAIIVAGLLGMFAAVLAARWQGSVQ
ncbi:AzlC family ABC transporter permease [Neisseriaceae bacterium CLB008]